MMFKDFLNITWKEEGTQNGNHAGNQFPSTVFVHLFTSVHVQP